MPHSALALLFLAATGLTPLHDDGYAALLGAHRNKIVLISFWATWCEPCREELPVLAALARRFANKDFQLVSISIDEPEQGRQAWKLWRSTKPRGPGYLANFENRDRFITSVDPQWSGALPALFLYDRSGRRVQSFTSDVDLPAVQQAVATQVALGAASP